MWQRPQFLGVPLKIAFRWQDSHGKSRCTPPIANSALPVRPPMPTMFTMLPWLAWRCGQAGRLQRIAPKNLSANPSSQLASVRLRKSPRVVAPALLTSRSSWPKRATAAATTAADQKVGHDAEVRFAELRKELDAAQKNLRDLMAKK